ncbi:uncharacterized protein LOC117780609 [Drosophila innubila]|uniref:uncharacterized protein LOC117780609 n=1 Tax=Drosophila innubila TaxID=198719 RepID=UPI00148E5053|nr:uncharacterized protein LOC117780609 [Drosophila innubila]
MSGPSRTNKWRLAQEKIIKESEQNCMERVYSSIGNSSVTAIHQKLDNLSSRLSSLESNVANVLAVVKKLAVNSKFTASVEFPVENLSSLEEINKKVEEDSQRYVALLRSTLMPEGVIKNLGRVLSLSLIMDMNYGGTFSKKGLNSFESLNSALYEAVKRDGYTFDDYKRDVRLAFSKAKNKVYKRNTELNKQKQQQIETIFIKEDETEETITDEGVKKRKKKKTIT